MRRALINTQCTSFIRISREKNFAEILSGVAQVFVVGPLLFNICICDHFLKIAILALLIMVMAITNLYVCSSDLERKHF